jgi:hypothetical protein
VTAHVILHHCVRQRCSCTAGLLLTYFPTVSMDTTRTVTGRGSSSPAADLIGQAGQVQPSRCQRLQSWVPVWLPAQAVQVVLAQVAMVQVAILWATIPTTVHGSTIPTTVHGSVGCALAPPAEKVTTMYDFTATVESSAVRLRPGLRSLRASLVLTVTHRPCLHLAHYY